MNGGPETTVTYPVSLSGRRFAVFHVVAPSAEATEVSDSSGTWDSSSCWTVPEMVKRSV